MSTLSYGEVVKLEEDVIALTRRLKDGVVGTKGHPAPVDRDMIGTLHVNLCALVREAERTIAKLETEHGFNR